MRVRKIELRILGLALAGLWTGTFALIMIGYRPGGPVDLLVGLAAAGPVLIALAGVARPPVARGDRAFALIAWLALLAMLLLVPSLAGLVGQLEGLGPQTLLPSLEAAYPWLVALVATSLFTGLGLSRHHLGDRAGRRRRLAEGAVIALALVAVSGIAFGAAAVGNEIALEGRPATASRFGPTGPGISPPPCDGQLVAGATAVLDLNMDVAVDGTKTGLVGLTGVRSGSDVGWSGFAATPVQLGTRGFIRTGGSAWEIVQGTARTVTGTSAADGRDFDVTLVAKALAPPDRVAAEDAGLAYIEGATARHCRVAVDGATLRLALPEVDLLVGDVDLSRWRGQIDYWVFADHELGQANGYAGGPALALGPDALQATIRFQLTAIDRGSPFTINPPQ